MYLKVYVRETPTTPASVPFISMAEMMKRFQSSTRDLALPSVVSHVWIKLSTSTSCFSARIIVLLNIHNGASLVQTKPKLTLTRPKEPEFETSQRVRPTRVKSSAELEEEMMAKIPKFKARTLNKKVLFSFLFSVILHFHLCVFYVFVLLYSRFCKLQLCLLFQEVHLSHQSLR